MKTIVFITNNFPPINCGVGDYTYNLASEFLKNGHLVHVVCKNSEKITKYWSNNHELLNVYPIVYNWSAKDLSSVLSLLKKISPDYLLIQYVPYAYNKIGVPFQMLRLYFFSRKYKILTTFHEFGKLQITKVKYIPIGLFQYLIGFIIGLRSHKIVVSTNAVKKFMPATKTIKLPVGSNFTICSELNNNSNPIFRICSAGLSQTRNQLLCESVIELIKEGNQIELVILGKVHKVLQEKFISSLSDSFKRFISFTSEISENDFSTYLNKSDLFCLIEYVDNKGEGGVGCKSGILAASFGHGLPVMITGGSLTDHDILKHGENVWIVPYDKTAIITNIKLLMSDKKIRNRLSLGAKATFEKSMSWPQIYKNYIKHLDNV